MGLFSKLITNEKLPEVELAPRSIQPQPEKQNIGIMMQSNGLYNLPYLVHQCMTRQTVEVGSVVYFQDIVSKLPILTRVQFKLLKANSKNTPTNWSYEKGDVCVFDMLGTFIGMVSKYQFEKHEMKTGKYYGFVEPPSRDFIEGISITPNYRVFLYLDFNAICNDSNSVIIEL